MFLTLLYNCVLLYLVQVPTIFLTSLTHVSFTDRLILSCSDLLVVKGCNIQRQIENNTNKGMILYIKKTKKKEWNS